MCERNVGFRLIRDMGLQVRIPGWAPYKEGSRSPEERRSVFIDVFQE